MRYPSAAEGIALCLASNSCCLSRNRTCSASKHVSRRGLLFDWGFFGAVERTVESTAEAARVSRSRCHEGTS